MIKTKLIHPEILQALGKAGHGSKVLIADGDYPVSTTLGKNAAVVYLNLMPGVVNCTQVLEALISTVVIEGAAVMDVPEGNNEPEIWGDYRKYFKENDYEFKLELIERFDFYENIKMDQVALVIQTGETREYANLLLTIGSQW